MLMSLQSDVSAERQFDNLLSVDRNGICYKININLKVSSMKSGSISGASEDLESQTVTKQLFE